MKDLTSSEVKKIFVVFDYETALTGNEGITEEDLKKHPDKLKLLTVEDLENIGHNLIKLANQETKHPFLNLSPYNFWNWRVPNNRVLIGQFQGLIKFHNNDLGLVFKKGKSIWMVRDSMVVSVANSLIVDKTYRIAFIKEQNYKIGKKQFKLPYFNITQLD
jgi:hypothetical protein